MESLELAKANRSKKINKIEKIKNSKDVMNVISSLESISNKGIEALEDADSKYFLKSFGIYHKGGNHFMIRIRIPAGRLNFQQALMIAELAKEYGNDYIDVTTRQQIELRYIKIEDLYTIIVMLEGVGITTYQTGVDNIRNIVTDPLDGIAHDNFLECFPTILKLQDIFLKNPEYISTLPRKFNPAILGSVANRANIFGHDCAFALSMKDGVYGFNVYLGGRVGMQAKDANIFVTEHNIEIFFQALLDIFKEYGFRDNRNKNRLVFLIEAVGMQKFTEAIKEKAGIEFEEAGELLVDSKGVASGIKIRQKNNKLAYKLVTPSGITSGSDLLALATLAKRYGSGDIRLGYDQNIYLIDLEEESLSEFLASDIILKYAKYNNIYFENLIACAGRETCSFGVIDNKPDAIELANFLNSEVALDDGKVRMNWSGCVKGCGVHGIADIGFEGAKAKDSEGNTVDGVHIFLGGKITKEAREAKTLLKSVPLTKAKYYVKYLLLAYKEHKRNKESFEEFESRFLKEYSKAAIGFYAIINYILEQNDLGFFELKANPKSGKNESFEIFDFGLRLYKLLSGENRYAQVIDFEPVIDRKIKEDEPTKLNPKVPLNLSKVIYKMTLANKQKRYQVFSEILVDLEEK